MDGYIMDVNLNVNALKTFQVSTYFTIHIHLDREHLSTKTFTYIYVEQ